MLPNTNKVKIHVKYGELTSLIQWCSRNCSGEWAYEVLGTAGSSAGEYTFYFEDEKDLFAFTFWKT